MSMTAFEREGLYLLGYSKRESEFLFLVATHSGYFTNRQFKAFARSESGSMSHAFIRKLLDRKHASFHTYRSGGRVYHLFARKVYQAIGRENLRTRKKHELDYVKTRLVALDFVIEHPEHHYLETEAGKIAFFEKEWNLRRETLPVKQYRARKSAEITPRYFVDRFPMFVDRLFSPPVVTFTYIEAGAITLEAFGTHLRAYLPLFQALLQLEFFYIAPTARLFKMAESEFQHVLCGVRDNAKSANLLHYFRLRKAWEAKERVTSADVVLLKESQARYASREVQELYEKWRSCAIADAEVTRISDEGKPPVRRVFRAMICGSSLSVFTDPRDNSSESSGENVLVAGLPQVSGTGSTEVSGT